MSPLHRLNTPLFRVMELWNVNHFIISQARPYLIPFYRQPFTRSQAPKIFPGLLGRVRRFTAGLFRLRLRQLSRLVNLPPGMQRLLMDENIPGPSITLKPEIGLADIDRLFRNPTKETIEQWIHIGEKSVWPCVAALQVRCDIELGLEKQYQYVRRHPPRELLLAAEEDGEVFMSGASRRRIRARSGSTDTNPL